MKPVKRGREESTSGSEERYRLVVENANEAIYVAQEGFLKFANPKTMEMIGYPKGDLTSTPFVKFIHPDDQGMVVERHLKRLRGEQPPSVYSLGSSG
jgi:two-component system cell cycle sensor histidine kinase/response regulator CckA